VESVGGTVYAGWRQQDSGFVINAGVSLAGARTNGSRAITLAGFTQSTQSLAGSTTGTTYQVFGELAFDLAKGTNTRIEPFVRNAYIGADIKALTETGGIAALTAPRASYNINVTNAGMRFGTALNGKIDVNASAAWQRTSGAREAATQIRYPRGRPTGQHPLGHHRQGCPAAAGRAWCQPVRQDPDRRRLLGADRRTQRRSRRARHPELRILIAKIIRPNNRTAVPSGGAVLLWARNSLLRPATQGRGRLARIVPLTGNPLPSYRNAHDLCRQLHVRQRCRSLPGGVGRACRRRPGPECRL
jgi:hypothetical protein